MYGTGRKTVRADDRPVLATKITVACSKVPFDGGGGLSPVTTDVREHHLGIFLPERTKPPDFNQVKVSADLSV